MAYSNPKVDQVKEHLARTYDPNPTIRSEVVRQICLLARNSQCEFLAQRSFIVKCYAFYYKQSMQNKKSF